MGVAAAPLVGRAEELALLDDALADLTRGEWKAVELVGEPGIGKTRLLEELTTRADRRGALVLSGSASELERDLPFWMFVNALDDYVRSLDPRLLELLDDEVRTELAQVFPALTGLATDKPAAGVHERYRTHRAVRELLERLTATGPLVLVLDDVHWADPASVELLGALLRRPPDAAVLIAVAVRPHQAPRRLAAALERAHRGGGLARVGVGALTRVEAAELLGEAVGDAAATALYEETGGNPFYLEQLARSLATQATTGTRELSLAGLEVPTAVAAALAEELTLISEGTRGVLQGAAVAGDPFEPDLAAAAASTTEESVLDALDELLRRGLVRPTEVPRRFRFRHPVVRRAVYESTPAGWRLGAHQRSSTTLAARGAPAAERAHHVERSARHGDATAVTTLREAGEAVAARAPATAAAWFGAALRLMPTDAPIEMRADLLLSRARALVATGQFGDALSALLESIGLVPTEAVAPRVRLTSACAGVEHLLGQHEQAHHRLTTAFDGLADSTSPEAAALMIELAMDGFSRMDYPRMRTWAERALTSARPLGDRALTAAAAAALTFAEAADGATTQAQTLRAETAHLVADLDDTELAGRLDAAVNLAGAELYLDRYPEAAIHAERALSVARATGQSAFIPLAYSILGQAQLLRGRLAEAGVLLDDAVDGARLSGNVQALAGNLINRSLVALAAGDLDLALSTAEENAELTHGLDQSLVCAASVALAATLLERGDPERAANILTTSSGGAELPMIPGVWRPRSLELLTRCWLALDRRSDARRAATTAGAAAAGLNLRMADAMADRAAAAVDLDDGDPATAAEHALASALAADQAGAPLEAALSRTLAGRALGQAGQPDRAAAELQHAANQLHADGALRHRAAAEQELRRLGHRVHRRSRAGTPDGVGIETLTERERQVAGLVVDRKTNPEIAAELFLSPKTVETHLRHIFHKLDVTSRADLARTIEASPQQRARLQR